MQKRKGLFTNMSNIKKYCAIITVDQVLMPVSHQDNKSINQLGIFQTQRKKERKEERRRCVTEEQKIWRRWGPTNGSMIWDFIAVILQKKKNPHGFRPHYLHLPTLFHLSLSSLILQLAVPMMIMILSSTMIPSLAKDWRICMFMDHHAHHYQGVFLSL